MIWNNRSGSEVSSSDESSPNTRSSSERIRQVVSKFCALKKSLVTEIGFQGMLKIPALKHIDKRFSLSLLQRIDIKKKSIRMNDNSLVQISSKDVKHFLDIPNGPNKLFGLEDRSMTQQMDFIRIGIGSLAFDIEAKNSLKAAEEIVTAEYPNGMTKYQVEAFKVSFVCFCMGNFLIAKYVSNHGVKDYWGSLMETSEISSFDFCQAVVDEIMEAARHVQKDMRSNKVVKNVSGCLLLLQVKFLDSLNLGILNIAESNSPRIELFTFNVIDEMKIYLTSNSFHIQTKKANISSLQKSGVSTSYGTATVSGLIRKGHQVNFGTTGCSITEPISFDETSWQETRGCGFYKGPDKGKRTGNLKICSYVNTVKSPKSTEYLSSYGKNGSEKRLNDKQLDALRKHNARMRLLVNSFKAATLKEMDCSESAKFTCKEIFNNNVNKLMEELLDQVHFVSTQIHDYCTSYTTARFIAPSLVGAQKRAFQTVIQGGEDAPLRARKARTFNRVINDITGKNLIHDLTMADDPWEAAENYDGTSNNGFVTPTTTMIKRQNSPQPNNTDPLSIDTNDAPPLQSCIGSMGSKGRDIFKTPEQMVHDLTQSPDGLGDSTDNDLFDDIIEDTTAIDLFQSTLNNDITYSPLKKVVIKRGEMARNPWFFATERAVIGKEVGEIFLNWLAVHAKDVLDSWWIRHSSPTLKMIAGNDFKSVFTRGYNVSEDMFDLAVRRAGQTDRNMYGHGIRKRWMHPFECDFANKVLGGGDYLSSRSVRHQLTGNQEDYDICDCRMISVPHHSMDTYTVYFWDMHEKIVHVVDPMFKQSKAGELKNLHAPIVDKLQAALEDCFSNAYVGWDVDWKPWQKNYIQPFLPDRKSNETGLLSLLALRHFNGTVFEVPQTEAALTQFSIQLMFDMLNVHGNTGVLPDVFVQAIG